MFAPRLREAHAFPSSCMMLIRILILMLVQDPHVQCPGVVRKSVFSSWILLCHQPHGTLREAFSSSYAGTRRGCSGAGLKDSAAPTQELQYGLRSRHG